MNTITMLKTKWYLVEMFTAKKQFRITVRKPLDTKIQAIEFENSRVKAHNYKSLCKLIQDGWTDLNSEADTAINPTQVNAVEVKETATNVIDLTGNAEVEEAIRQNYIKSKERKGIQFVKGASIKEVSNVEAEYFAKLTQTKPTKKESEFQKVYDEKWNKYIEKRGKEIEKEKEVKEVTI